MTDFPRGLHGETYDHGQLHMLQKGHHKDKKKHNRKRPCGSDIPNTPANVVLVYDKLRARHDKWRLRVDWDDVTHKQDGSKVTPDFYAVQLQHSATNDFSGDEKVRHVIIKSPDDGDRGSGPSNDPKAGAPPSHYWFSGIAPNHYYRARVKAGVKGDACDGLWSDWTSGFKAKDTNRPPGPVNGSLSAWGHPNHVGIDWQAPLSDINDDTDVEEWDPDIDYFQVQVSTKANFSTIAKKHNYIVGESFEFRTTSYKQNYWFRVRAMDAAGNASSTWANAPKAGPVRPQQIKARRGSDPGIDWTSGDGYPLAGRATNRAYLVSTNVTGVTYITGMGDLDGDLYATLSLSPTEDKVSVGVDFRYKDLNNHLWCAISCDGTSNRIELWKIHSSTWGLLGSSVVIPVMEGDTCDLHVNLNGNVITCYFNGTQEIQYTLTGDDATDFGTGGSVGTTDRVGIWQYNAVDGDDGKSRISYIKFVDSDGTIILEDDFDRDASASSLGTASSGQTWNAGRGTWGISADGSSSDALYGMGVILPIYYGEDTNARTPTTPSSGWKKMGEGGADTSAIEIDVDRPMMFTMWSTLTHHRGAGEGSFGLTHSIGVSDDGGSTILACRQTRDQEPDDANYRSMSNMSQYFYDPGEGNVVTLDFYWLYGNDAGVNKVVNLGMQKMVVFATYAPDYDPTDQGETNVTRNIPWARSGRTRKAYQKGLGWSA